MAGMPEAEVSIDVALVRALLASQHPDLAGLALRRVAEGWDNEIWRLGDELAVRLPRRAVVADLIEREQRWLPVLAPRLPLAVPAPQRLGRPDDALGYPWPWSVVSWFPGASALDTPPPDPAATARTLGDFLAALHHPAPAEVPPSPHGRGAPLRERDRVVRERVATLVDLPRDQVLSSWEASCGAPVWTGAPQWVHGDLHPANIIVDPGGALTAVIDFVDVAAGDPAVDLSVAWMMVPPAQRSTLRTAAGGHEGPVDDATWRRARGNALAHAVAVLANSDDNPRMAAMGRHTLQQVLADGDR